MIDRQRHPDALIGREEELVLVEAATLAPSLHNSQPWQFSVSDHGVELFADPSRHLRRVDPSGRSLLISCGAAVFNLRVAAEHLGFHPRVRLLPDPDQPTMIASVQVDHRHGRSAGLGAYFSAIPARRTNRWPFHNTPVPHSVIARLMEAVRSENAILRIDDNPNEVARIVDLLHDADRAERDDFPRQEEQAAWVGIDDHDEGIPVGSLGPRPAEPRTAYRDLAFARDVTREYVRFEPTPTVAVLSTMHDQPLDWVRSGQALQSLLLEATREGLAASFMNQPLERDDLRWLVRSPTSGLGHPQMILRIGYGDPVPATPRRPLDTVIRRRHATPQERS